MRRIGMAILVSAAMWSGCASQPTAGRAGEPFFFIQAADPQIPWGPAELWAKAIAETGRLRPAFLVVTGDLTHDAADEAARKQYLDIAGRLDRSIPLYNVAGNHDVGDKPTPQTLSRYREHYGPLWYTFEHGNCLFIVLESDLFRSPQSAPESAAAQMAWLRKTLADSDIRGYWHKIVLMHHPVCVVDMDQWTGWGIPKPFRHELVELLGAHGVRAVFSGHFHRNALVKAGGMELVTTASSGKPLGDDPPGLRIIKVWPDRIEHAYYPYSKLPQKITMAP